MNKAFISYDAERHGKYKNLIKAWETNDDYFTFNDNSTDTSINSINETYIRSRIKQHISASDVFIVIVGDYVSMNKWVGWECEQARRMGKRIYAIKDMSHYEVPSELDGYYNLYVLNGFTKANVRRALGYLY